MEIRPWQIKLKGLKKFGRYVRELRETADRLENWLDRFTAEREAWSELGTLSPTEAVREYCDTHDTRMCSRDFLVDLATADGAEIIGDDGVTMTMFRDAEEKSADGWDGLAVAQRVAKALPDHLPPGSQFMIAKPTREIEPKDGAKRYEPTGAIVIRIQIPPTEPGK